MQSFLQHRRSRSALVGHLLKLAWWRRCWTAPS